MVFALVFYLLPLNCNTATTATLFFDLRSRLLTLGRVKANSALLSLTRSLLFIYVDWRAFRESDAVCLIEGFQVNFVKADARLESYDSTD